MSKPCLYTASVLAAFLSAAPLSGAALAQDTQQLIRVDPNNHSALSKVSAAIAKRIAADSGTDAVRARAKDAVRLGTLRPTTDELLLQMGQASGAPARTTSSETAILQSRPGEDGRRANTSDKAEVSQKSNRQQGGWSADNRDGSGRGNGSASNGGSSSGSSGGGSSGGGSSGGGGAGGWK